MTDLRGELWPQTFQTKVVGAKLTPAGLDHGQSAKESEILFVRWKKVDPGRQRNGVSGKGTRGARGTRLPRNSFKRRRIGEEFLTLDTGRPAGQHLDIFAQHFLDFVQIDPGIIVAEDAQAGPRFQCKKGHPRFWAGASDGPSPGDPFQQALLAGFLKGSG